MRLRSLEDLAPCPARALVINVHTDLLAARALLSAVQLADMPVLLVNCDPTSQDARRFDELGERYGFDVLESPIARHGDLLDRLFAESGDECLLLLDSDAELRDAGFVRWMVESLGDHRVFGAGYLEGPFWAPPEWWAPVRSLLYMQRPWVPCAMLRVPAARRALAAGCHFSEQILANEVWFSRRASNFLAARFPAPWGRHSRAFARLPALVRAGAPEWRLDFLRPLHRAVHGVRPKIVVYDTAAKVYEHLRYVEGLPFAGLDLELNDGKVHHYGGVTRSAMYGPMPIDTLAADVEAEVRDHLLDRYDHRWEA